MKNELKTLSEYNSEKLKWHITSYDKPILNGISCPDCGNELFDSNPMSTLTSDPPQKNIHCNNCGYKGYRIA